MISKHSKLANPKQRINLERIYFINFFFWHHNKKFLNILCLFQLMCQDITNFLLRKTNELDTPGIGVLQKNFSEISSSQTLINAYEIPSFKKKNVIFFFFIPC